MEHSVFRKKLRVASQCLTSHGLNVAAKWILELLCGLLDPGRRSTVSLPNCDYVDGEDGTDNDDDTVFLAKACFDSREYERCAHLIETSYCSGAESGLGDSDAWRHAPPRARFLRWYALFLDGERRKELDRFEGADTLGKARPPVNARLPELQAEMEAAESERPGLDSFGRYLLGVVHKACGRKDKARECFVNAVRGFPMLWSAWVDLASTCTNRTDVDSLVLPGHWMSDLFRAHTYVHLHLPAAAIQLLAPLSAAFPEASPIKALVARALYYLHRYDAACTTFAHLVESDPHRLEDMDVYANVLFTQDDRPKLAALAHAVHGTDRFRPSSCCVLGNYFSMRREHSKAVTYFRRALRLDPSYVDAWLLMGHEYVELRDSSAAVECYRRATVVAEGDYRAWYGLGQAYETQGGGMPLYAAHYYRKAVSLQPYDARMWVALGDVADRMERKSDAIAAYERAVALPDRALGGSATLRLAKLYAGQLDEASALKYYSLYVQQVDPIGSTVIPRGAAADDLGDALLVLARQANAEGRHDAAERYCARMLQLAIHPSRLREASTLRNETSRLRMLVEAAQGRGGVPVGSARAVPASAAHGGGTEGRAAITKLSSSAMFAAAATARGESGGGMSMSFSSPDPKLPVFGVLSASAMGVDPGVFGSGQSTQAAQASAVTVTASLLDVTGHVVDTSADMDMAVDFSE